MKAIFALLCGIVCATVLMGQTPTPTWEQRIDLYQRSFKPELVSVGPPSTALDRSKEPVHYCVQPSPDRKSMSIKRCPPQRRERFQLIPPLQRYVPDTRK